MTNPTTYPASQVSLAVRKFVDRAGDVLDSDHRNFEHNFRAFLAHCEKDPIISIITQPLKASDRPETDLEKWYQDFNATGGSFIGTKRYAVPEDEELMLSLFYKFFLAIDADEIDLGRFAVDAFGKTQYDDMVYDFNRHFFRKWIREMSYRLEGLEQEADGGNPVSRDRLLFFNVRNLISVTGDSNQLAVDSSQVTNFGDGLRAEELRLLLDLVADLRNSGNEALASKVQAISADLEDVAPTEVVAVFDEVLQTSPGLKDRMRSFVTTIGAGASGSLIARAIELLLMGT